MSRKLMAWAGLGVFSCFLFVANVSSQSIGGAIVGQVKDGSGAGVEAALVQITSAGTGRTRVVSTTDDGHFAAREIPPGTYDITVLKGGFNSARRTSVPVGVSQVADVAEITLAVAPVGGETVEVKEADVSPLETDSPALSASFAQRQIRELPLQNRDVNGLALLAAGVSSARTFSFASTLVPFASSGSRGRNNNFIIDSVDNNEPLFGGAATQFTNTDLFSEFRIFTGIYKAEYGRNSGSVVNAVTASGTNSRHGTAFWHAQRDAMNAENNVEQFSGLSKPAPYREDVIGGTLGGPLKRDSTWFYASYQWDEIRSDLSSIYPTVATLPTLNGLNTLSALPLTRTLEAYLSDPTVSTLPIAGAPCVNFITGLPAMNPCTISGPPGSGIAVGGAPVEFGSYLVPEAGLFQSRDHQASLRLDRRLGPRDDLSGRYLLDDLLTPVKAGSTPIEVGFFDPGLYPTYGDSLAQRTQNGGIFWTHTWPRALHELRASFSRIATDSGSLNIGPQARETLPATTVSDSFALQPTPDGTPAGTAQLLSAFQAGGNLFTMGRDTRPTEDHTTRVQFQDNLSMSIGRHSLKLGANFVRTLSDLRSVPSDLGEYFYSSSSGPNPGQTISGFQNFASNAPQFAVETFPNLGGSGGELLPLREFSQFYFFQDDIRLTPRLTLSLGLRYENFGQPINRVAELNPAFGAKIARDNMDFGPRIGFAGALGNHTVLRGGYGMYYDPTVFNVALLAWQSGPISPFVSGTPSNVYPQPPFNPSDALRHVTDCDSLTLSGTSSGPTFVDCSAQDTIARDLKQPRTHNFSLGLQHEFGADWVSEVNYVGTIGTGLPQRRDLNPRSGYAPCSAQPCTYLPRLDPAHGDIFEVFNGAHSTYHALQASVTKRIGKNGWLKGLSFTSAYTWSHWVDNASDIFGPEVRRVRSFKFLRKNAAPIEVITPFAQDFTNATSGERGDSSYDRRHHVALSFLWSLPSPGGAARWYLGGWEMSGIFTAQTGTPFSPLNSFGACTDANGDGILTNDRPSIGNPTAPVNRIALVADPNCLSVVPGQFSPTGYVDSSGSPIDPATAHFVQVPLGVNTGTAFSAGSQSFVAGNAGRNVLRGPGLTELDFAVHKNFRLTEGLTLQLRGEALDLLNSRNAGYALGNPFIVDTLAAPAIAFGTTSPSVTPARATGLVPENSLDSFDSQTGQSLFLSRAFMNTSSRRLQTGLRLIF
jgi:hypothetical protein